MSDCMRAIEINSKCIEAYNHFGHIHLEQGNIINALCNRFMKALKRNLCNCIIGIFARFSITSHLLMFGEVELHIGNGYEFQIGSLKLPYENGNEALPNLIKESFLPLVQSTRHIAPREAPSTSTRPSQSGDNNTNKSLAPKTIESGEVKNMEEVLALLSISSSNLDDPLGSKP
ncbi:hypothetical protein CK203_023461 [Vitis vinifera]|uniref:Uncharacterized protein n=1 Tax=Vitis vinifera TaxID=29760 RepID=A0A438J6F0_VITVI|nr:hypothetical protein CK203_023461 [Vitis vinifera]